MSMIIVWVSIAIGAVAVAFALVLLAIGLWQCAFAFVNDAEVTIPKWVKALNFTNNDDVICYLFAPAFTVLFIGTIATILWPVLIPFYTVYGLLHLVRANVRTGKVMRKLSGVAHSHKAKNGVVAVNMNPNELELWKSITNKA